MAQFYHQSIIPSGVQNENGQDVLRFDVNNAIQRTQNAPEKGYGISSYVQNRIETQEQTVDVAIDKVMAVLTPVVGGVIVGFEALARVAIEQAFTGLSSQEQKAWIFWNQKDASSVQYAYNIYFGFRSSNGMYLVGLPIGLEIIVNLSKTKVLGLTTFSKASYLCKLDVLRVGKRIRNWKV